MIHIRGILFLIIFSLTLTFIAFFPTQDFAASLQVSWSADTDADLEGYKVYFGTQSGTYGSGIDVGNVTSYQINGVQNGATYYLAVSAHDTSQNESALSAEQSVSIPVLDTTPPSGSVSINSGAASTTSTAVTLTLSASDAVSSVTGMKFSNDGVTYSSEVSYATSYSWMLVSGDGLKTVYVLFKDSSGNWMSSPVTDAIQLSLDSDGDGLPDTWETTYGLNPNFAGDASLDSDSDGVSNLNEYLNGTNPTNATDNAPVANAGSDQNVIPQRVMLNGSSSYDPTGGSLSYRWTQTGGPTTVILEDSTQSVAYFVGITAGMYTFRLSCSDGYTTSTDNVNVVILNVAPVVSAGSNMTIDVGNSVTLHATGSDSNEDTLTYLWTKTSGPSITLPSLSQQNITFTPSTAGKYLFSVTCSDGVNTSESDGIVVTVNAINSAPTANAGADQDVNKSSIVQLSGSDSSDPDGNTLTYSWSQLSGTTVTLSSTTAANPTFTASTVGTFEFQLVVNDGYVSSTPDTVTIRVVSQNTPPVANAGSDIHAYVGEDVVLDASGSYDPDLDGLTYTWSQVSGAMVQILNANTISAFFTPTTSGTFEFMVTVSDGQITSTDNVIITVDNANQVPIANAGSNVTATKGATVTLNGSASYDPDGDAISYIWSQTGGTVVSLSGSNTAKPSFAARQEGVYVFQLVVYDGTDTSSASSVTVTVQSSSDEITLVTPTNNSVCYSSPTLTWASSGFKNYNAYISINGGKKYTKVYSGSDKSTTLDAVLWQWFIPAGTTVNWYVQGTKTSGSNVKSFTSKFKKQ